MSGGAWDYQQFKLQEKAGEIKDLLEAVAETERIVDWAVCGDTSIDDAGPKLFELWRETFERLYG